MNTEHCRLRVAAFTIPHGKVNALWYDGCPGKFMFTDWVFPDDWEFGQNEKIRARFVRVAPVRYKAIKSHATQEGL